MSTPEREAELPEQAEALLDGWPAPTRSALEWEDLANSTVARIRGTTVGSTDDDILAPPLPKEEAEGEFQAKKPVVDHGPIEEPGLLAIAKAAVSAGSGDDEKDIVRAGLKAAEHSRQSHPPAPPVRAAGHVRHGTPSSAAGLQGHLPRDSGRPVQAVHEAHARSEVPAASRRGGDKMSSGVIVTGAMLALAAAVALYVAVHKSSDGGLVASTTREVAPAPPNQFAEAPANTATAQAEEAAAKPKMLALDDLKPSDTTTTDSAKVVVPSASSPMTLALRSKGDLSGSAAAAGPAPVAKKSAAAPAMNAAPSEPQQQAVTLKETEEPETLEHAAPAAPAKEALPSHPSTGAIQGAVGAVMSGARSCLAGQETGSKATITFGPDGHVKAVGVAGPAAGTPAEACVRSALMGARVPAFSDPEYSASFTVRPP